VQQAQEGPRPQRRAAHHHASESSDETFEQHRRLRTRAEDYVHKPIAFADLVDRMRNFVAVGSPTSEPIEDAIIIDDEIAFEEPEEEDVHTVMMDRPSLDVLERAAGAPPRSVPAPMSADLDVERFANDAFDHLLDTTGKSQPPTAKPPSVPAAPSTEPPARPSRPVARRSTPPGKYATGADHGRRRPRRGRPPSQ